MIGRQEIIDFSRELGLLPNVVEKDYALGWILAGIAVTEGLNSAWVFKGGTALKKCFFETYRFSEDLDFTVSDRQYLETNLLIEIFQSIADWIYDNAGVEIPKGSIRFDAYTNPRGNTSVQGRISYRGPLRPGGDLPRIRFDLTNDEVVVLTPEIREAYHPYSDSPDGGISVLCYPFEELFAEKIRALAERERPRDLYDVIHLYRHSKKEVDRPVLVQTLTAKCDFKRIALPTFDRLAGSPYNTELRSEWENMLGHQLPVLPPFEQFWAELPDVFGWLYGKQEGAVKPPMPSVGIDVDEGWRAPSMATAWHEQIPLEIVRYAGANRLCVDLQYQGKRRIIEPYSLRRSREGHLLLYAVKHGTGEARSYRVDRIEGVTITKETFTPRYSVEFSESGPLVTPTTNRGSGTRSLMKPKKTHLANRRARKPTPQFGPKCLFRCSVCGKEFVHRSYDASLNPHNDKHGYPCGGRLGMYVGMK